MNHNTQQITSAHKSSNFVSTSHFRWQTNLRSEEAHITPYRDVRILIKTVAGRKESAMSIFGGRYEF